MRQEIELVVSCNASDLDDAEIAAGALMDGVMEQLKHRKPELISMRRTMTITRTARADAIEAINRQAKRAAAQEDSHE